MKLKALCDKEIDGFGQTMLFAVAAVATGHNMWILGGMYDQTFLLCYEHPRGDIEAPPVGWTLQFHSSQDGFVSPTWRILISAGIKFGPRGEVLCP